MHKSGPYTHVQGWTDISFCIMYTHLAPAHNLEDKNTKYVFQEVTWSSKFGLL